MSLLFGSLPVASRILWGVWGFEGAAEISFLGLILGTYFHIAGRWSSAAIPDSASMMNQAIELASLGQTDEAVALLTQAIRFSPRLWQAYQYRGEIYLSQRNSAVNALQDFTEAIGLAPQEPCLFWLRGQALRLLGDDSAARRDHAIAVELSAKEGHIVSAPEPRSFDSGEDGTEAPGPL